MTGSAQSPVDGFVEFGGGFRKQLVEKAGPSWTVRQVLSEIGMPNVDALMAPLKMRTCWSCSSPTDS